MEYDIEKVNRLFRTMTARKISVISRLAGLNEEEIRIMKLRWLENHSDVQICEELNISTATLTRKRRLGYAKVLDAMDLYGLSDLEELPVADILDYSGLFYRCQDELIRFFVRTKGDEERQKDLLAYLTELNGD